MNVHRCREPSLPARLASVPPVAPGARPAHVLVASTADLGPAELADPWALGPSVAGEALGWVIQGLR